MADHVLAEYVLYFREGCHLCEDMISQMHSILAAYDGAVLELRNIDDNPDWQALFDKRVPVLMHGERVLSEFFLDEFSVRKHLNGQHGGSKV